MFASVSEDQLKRVLVPPDSNFPGQTARSHNLRTLVIDRGVRLRRSFAGTS